MDKILEFTGNHTLLVLGLMVSFFILIFTELRRKAGGLLSVDANAAVKLINNDALVVDLRSADAYSAGHIVSSKSIPSDELESKMSTLEAHKTSPIVLVCDTGNASSKTVATMRAAGFDSAYGLAGGIAAWNQAGMPVVTGRKTKAKGNKDKGKKDKKGRKKKSSDE